jgi:pimeloyl-[acyl-carrier protein] methyl ester esterase
LPYIKTRPDLNLYYRLEGKGKSIFFIHGWAGDSNVWQQQIDFFSKRYKTIALDLPGHGKSNWRKSDLKDLSMDIKFILDKQKVEKINLVAASFSGLVALQFASAFPGMLERLILVDTAAKFLSEDEKCGITEQQIKKLAVLIEENFVMGLLVFARSLFTMEERKLQDFKEAWEISTHKVILPKKIALRELLNILLENDLRPILPNIKTPTLIVSGEKDYICGKPKAEELMKGLPNAVLKFIEGSGHLPFLTQPDIFNKILEEFIVNGKIA